MRFDDMLGELVSFAQRSYSFDQINHDFIVKSIQGLLIKNQNNFKKSALFVDSLSTICAVFVDRLPAFWPAEVAIHMY